MKKLTILILITIFITSCWLLNKQEENIENWSINTNENIDSKNDIETESNINEDKLSTNNNKNMETIQTKGLENGDTVAIVKTTNWTIKIKLFTELATITTTNFIALSKKDYYNGIIFHRVIKWFMIQWGDPDGTGTWGDSIYKENFEDEFTPELKNIKYSISMANSGPNTNWSQFFINQADNNFLDNKHSVFGQVVEWSENVDKIAKVKTWANDKPEKDVKIITVEIKEYQNWTFKDYNFDETKELNKIEKIKMEKKEVKKNKSIEVWDTVWVHYNGTFENWEKFDSSYDRWKPIEFIVWAGQMIKWFDDWVIWMKIWEKKSLKLAPKDAYWEKEISIPKADLKSFTDNGYKLEKWEILETSAWKIKILSVDEIFIKIENNNEMAWKTLNFDIEIVEIK